MAITGPRVSVFFCVWTLSGVEILNLQDLCPVRKKTRGSHAAAIAAVALLTTPESAQKEGPRCPF